MVNLSYNHLPSHLKPCFLYLSIFPEDFEIERRRLVERWITEGFIRAQAGMTLEDVGHSYFNELISRSMIQPSKVNLAGIIKSCRVHDIIRDIIVSHSREESFVYTSSDNAHIPPKENFRHVAYHVNKCSMIEMDWNHVRSLTIFGERPIEHGPSVCSPRLRMRMIRAIDLENADFEVTQKDISNIGSLRHLKYVKICNSKKCTLEWLDSVSSLPLPRSLTLRGRIGDKVDWFMNLTQLVKLRLLESRLEEGTAVVILGALPNLTLLHLECDAYVGKKLVFRLGAFQKLRKLHFSGPIMGSSVLREIRFEQDASPQMESIQVAHCTLKLGINGIKHLRKLKEISLSYDCKVVRLRMLLQEVNAHPNQPVLRLWKDRSQHDLGDPEGTYEDFDAAESLREHDGEGTESTTPTASATVKQAQRRQSKMLDRPACNLLQLIPDVRLLVATGPASYLALAVSIHS